MHFTHHLFTKRTHNTVGFLQFLQYILKCNNIIPEPSRVLLITWYGTYLFLQLIQEDSRN